MHAPLLHCLLDNAMIKCRPFLHQSLPQMCNVRNAPFVDTLASRSRFCSPLGLDPDYWEARVVVWWNQAFLCWAFRQSLARNSSITLCQLGQFVFRPSAVKTLQFRYFLTYVGQILRNGHKLVAVKHIQELYKLDNELLSYCTLYWGAVFYGSPCIVHVSLHELCAFQQCNYIL